MKPTKQLVLKYSNAFNNSRLFGSYHFFPTQLSPYLHSKLNTCNTYINHDIKEGRMSKIMVIVKENGLSKSGSNT